MGELRGLKAPHVGVHVAWQPQGSDIYLCQLTTLFLIFRLHSLEEGEDEERKGN